MCDDPKTKTQPAGKTNTKPGTASDPDFTNPGVAALQHMFAHADPIDAIGQAREIVAFLQAVKFDEELLNAEAIQGRWLVLSLLANLLEQAHHSIDNDTLSGTTRKKNLTAVGE